MAELMETYRHHFVSPVLKNTIRFGTMLNSAGTFATFVVLFTFIALTFFCCCFCSHRASRRVETVRARNPLVRRRVDRAVRMQNMNPTLEELLEEDEEDVDDDQPQDTVVLIADTNETML
ncbi:hypothetical protein GCK72_015467 [Caenorhabditis remanei]|uniref:Uncharacterized protein n=1 Tax=Caenorhabditis remanei TaxID=31234 RepID=A0A6A5GV17_CAERE|nr:hypothetical protein GCK72_015467 [Caenorhabditis remanei]KAF1759007.1 hypothetical protein GCK72_015467 [Caenorhabditis remanei]